ncbi:transporter substrate-binding domain-containing protein [Curvibacter sp. APW13]|uniref:substrate-binding periplasmic protein n=1 Tax=Curvibacter sp. APW13 TaxID=3077236 RepID=UPI0028DF2565|nr:transporter substrate-binding domain-containing protein [Curvibacter sp. APW13]MDT8991818.1 transporter substrate-binding domain-containing protein [Curvibacter sp. APW13]
MRKTTAWLAIFALSTTVMAKDLTLVAQEYPPFNWSEGGELKGGMVEVMKRVCERLKYQCTFSSVPLARGIMMLQDGSADGMLSLIPNAERSAYAHFSPTVVVSKVSYFGARDKFPKVHALKDLDGWTVGGVRASSSLNIAKEHQKEATHMTLIDENNNETLVKKLQAGRYGEKGAIIGGDAVLAHEAAKIKLDLDVVLEGVPQNFVNAFSKKSVDTQTMAQITKAIVEMKKSGEIKTILSSFGLKGD